MQDENDVLLDPRQEAEALLAETAPPDSDVMPRGHGLYVNRGGAPKGNQNARKHGLYSRLLPPERREELVEEMPPKSLTPEIDALRVRLADLMADPQVKLNDILPVLRVLGHLVSINQKFASIGR